MALTAQITAPGCNATRHTQYPVTPRKDSVFIFCASSSGTGTLYAASPGGTPPFTFTWTQYDNVSKSFVIPVLTVTGITSTAPSLGSGGYRVHITDNFGYDTYLYAWVDISDPGAKAALKNSTCYYVALDGTSGLKKFYYYDPSTGAETVLPNSLTYLWTSDPESTIPPNTEDPIISTPPLANETYTFRVTDEFGCTASASFYYESYHVKADFTATPDQGDAPLEVTFTNSSVRDDKCTWDFGDDSISYLPDPPAHIYYVPGTYTITLHVESDKFCEDTYTSQIVVNPSALEMPNVFSPNGDGINDYLVPEKASLKFVEMDVYSKGGQRVYHYNGDGESLSDWKGWDGNILNSNRKAEPGVYYYVIRAKGWDEKKYSGAAYRGVVYLYR